MLLEVKQAWFAQIEKKITFLSRSPDSSEALAATEIKERHLEALVLGRHLGEAQRRRHVVERFTDQRLGRAGLAGVVQAEHQDDDVPL